MKINIKTSKKCKVFYTQSGINLEQKASALTRGNGIHCIEHWRGHFG